MADIFVDERVAYYNTQDKSNRIEVKLVDSVIDAPLYKPKPTTNALAGGVLGALIGALIVLVLEWMSADILATPADVERVLGLPVSGTIPSLAGHAIPAAQDEEQQRHEVASATKTNLVSLSDPLAGRRGLPAPAHQPGLGRQRRAAAHRCWSSPAGSGRRQGQRPWPTWPSPLPGSASG